MPSKLLGPGALLKSSMSKKQSSPPLRHHTLFVATPVTLSQFSRISSVLCSSVWRCTDCADCGCCFTAFAGTSWRRPPLMHATDMSVGLCIKLVCLLLCVLPWCLAVKHSRAGLGFFPSDACNIHVGKSVKPGCTAVFLAVLR